MTTSITDRKSKLRQLMNFGGVNSLTYYSAIIITDQITYWIPTAIFVICYEVFVKPKRNGLLMLIIFLIFFGILQPIKLNLVGFLFNSES